MVGDYRGSFSRSSDDASPVEEETTSSVYSAGKEFVPIEWTDEKHSLYLKSMEASFVDRLYNSLRPLGSNFNKENVPEIEFVNRRKSYEQQKMNVNQPEYRLNGRHGGSREFLRSHLIKHYKHLPKIENPVKEEGSSICFKQILREGCSHSRDRDQIIIGEEVSDQNFVNEVTKGENGSSKKKKTAMSGSSSTDQVVPIRKAFCNVTQI